LKTETNCISNSN